MAMTPTQLSIRSQRMHAMRSLVFSLLGERCSLCSSMSDLQCHVHLDDKGQHHRWGSAQRWAFYADCAKAGVASILCRRCHNGVSFIERQYGRGSPQALKALRPLALQRESTPL
jgi:hypothetical protein